MLKPFEDIRGRLLMLEAARQNISAQAAPHVTSTAETDMCHLLSAVDALMEVGRAAQIVHNQCAAVDMDKVTAIGRLAVHGTLDGPLGALPPELKEAL